MELVHRPRRSFLREVSSTEEKSIFGQFTFNDISFNVSAVPVVRKVRFLHFSYNSEITRKVLHRAARKSLSRSLAL